jgi:hypothetical protein
MRNDTTAVFLQGRGLDGVGDVAVVLADVDGQAHTLEDALSCPVDEDNRVALLEEFVSSLLVALDVCLRLHEYLVVGWLLS